MTSGVQTNSQFQLWEKLKYEGFFHVEWLLVKDVPNYVFTDVKMSNTLSKKSITSCRDCEEVMFEEVGEALVEDVTRESDCNVSYIVVHLLINSQANAFLSIFTQFESRSSAWDDFAHYDELQSKLELKRGLILPDEVDKGDLNLYLLPLSSKKDQGKSKIVS